MAKKTKPKNPKPLNQLQKPKTEESKDEQEEAMEFQKMIFELEDSCQRKQTIMERKHEEHKTAKTSYEDSVNTLRETIRAYNKPLPLLENKQETNNA